uniref:Helix-turn-helix domain-containing protein n=1 Tax=Candidatus Kentrum sp. MB TaxID=2138164 RepID=A0A450X4Y6_9GAMM|nr:MAG: Helix-turn-helix domain-containing protein [Candidatus Kentron sp. MB]VFK34320.1 MAG: Helix-turn-helix domain-containing protein [Candidatus Kentron sp. MB]VFK76655.1 MAG: Helix-turn-helix domain-containing protein [Candidatus Kentron sp. MB]
MNRHTGSNFDDFLKEDGILEEVSARAHKRLLSIQLVDIMRERQITEDVLAERLNTSQLQLNQLLDPENTSVTIEILEHLAHAVGKKLHIEFA